MWIVRVVIFSFRFCSNCHVIDCLTNEFVDLALVHKQISNVVSGVYVFFYVFWGVLKSKCFFFCSSIMGVRLEVVQVFEVRLGEKLLASPLLKCEWGSDLNIE